jgi:hypothetical protein
VYQLVRRTGADSLYERLLRDNDLREAAVQSINNSRFDQVIYYVWSLWHGNARDEARAFWQVYALSGLPSDSSFEQFFERVQIGTRCEFHRLLSVLKAMAPVGLVRLDQWLTDDRCVAVAGRLTSLNRLRELRALTNHFGRPKDLRTRMLAAFFEKNDPSTMGPQFARMTQDALWFLLHELVSAGLTGVANGIARTVGVDYLDQAISRPPGARFGGTLRRARRRLLYSEEPAGSGSRDLMDACLLIIGEGGAQEGDASVPAELCRRLRAAIPGAAEEDVCAAVRLACSDRRRYPELVSALFEGIAQREDVRVLLRALPGVARFYLGELARVDRALSGRDEEPRVGAKEEFNSNARSGEAGIVDAILANSGAAGAREANRTAKSGLGCGELVRDSIEELLAEPEAAMRWFTRSRVQDVACLFYYGRGIEKGKLEEVLLQVVQSGYLERRFGEIGESADEPVQLIWNVGFALGKEGLETLATDGIRLSISSGALRINSQSPVLRKLELVGMADMVWHNISLSEKEMDIVERLVPQNARATSTTETYSKPFYGMRLALGLQVLGMGLERFVGGGCEQQPEWYTRSLKAAREMMDEERSSSWFLLETGWRALEAISPKPSEEASKSDDPA